MAKFKTSINLADALQTLQASANAKGRTLGKEFYVVVEAFNFGRDINGNTINKYRASLHCDDLPTVQNGYSNVGAITVLTSPYRREQSHNEGQSAALYWLEKIGYDLAYVSMTDETKSVYRGENNGYVSYRHVYQVKNNYLKG
ncbi:hypothetical protein Hena1_02520 [Erwinia phage Hena1]|uniref:Uncharacterized protein n=1 Tax=Erwinia phage Hena1 TaxID=2678601 RepID=A0A6B9JCN3_9CAUD|nr:hypothetical protein HWC84_gp112 [Erwinia phage Hena1]QGZ16402.1 hypothetical protein Hena1_02520 [Erwinia phage Hena1]